MDELLDFLKEMGFAPTEENTKIILGDDDIHLGDISEDRTSMIIGWDIVGAVLLKHEGELQMAGTEKIDARRTNQ